MKWTSSSLFHEIRNPLNAIFLHAEVLEEELLDLTPDHQTLMRESLSEIKRELDRVNNLVQDYLSLARLSTLQRTPEAMGALVEECALELTRVVRGTGDNATPGSSGGVRAGGTASPYISSAAAACDAECGRGNAAGGTLTLRGRRQGRQMVLEISDTGVGIPAE